MANKLVYMRVLPVVLLTDYFMAVNSFGHVGDQVALTSVLHQFQQPVCVTFEFLLQESEPGTSSTLSVYLLTLHHVPIRLRLKKVWSGRLRAGWKKGCVYIQSGTYHVMFLATLGLPYRSDVYLDNIDFALDNYCSRENNAKPTGNAIFF